MRNVDVVLKAMLAGGFLAGAAWGQAIDSNQAYTGGGHYTIARPDAPIVTHPLSVEATFSAASATLLAAIPGQAPVAVEYGKIEIFLGQRSVFLLLSRDSNPGSALPPVIYGQSRIAADGTILDAIGWSSGQDLVGSFRGLLVMQLALTIETPPPPPEPPTQPTLPSFDGTTLRVPDAWGIRKFEGWAQRLAAKYGTLPGGTTATIPSAWRDGVLQCHGANGFVYEIPLTQSYQGFLNGSILYAPTGTFPDWEPQDRWHSVATGNGHVKYAFR